MRNVSFRFTIIFSRIPICSVRATLKIDRDRMRRR